MRIGRKIKKVKIVEWSEPLSVGIKDIDLQHRTLLRMTNDLFTGCLYGKEIAGAYFRTTARRTLEYIRCHFADEENLMEKIAYPCLAEHRRRHREYTRDLMNHIRKFESGEEYIPGKFARYLGERMLVHIGSADQKYGIYYANKMAAEIRLV
jgi:hemerythrin